MDEPMDDPLAVTRAVWEYVSENLSGYLLGSLVMLGVSVVGWLASMTMLMASLVPAWVMGDESVAQISVVIGLTAAAAVLFAFMVATMLMQASFMRAMHGHLLGGEPLAWNSPLSTTTKDMPRLVVFFMVSALLTMVAGMFCVIPAIPVVSLAAFAMPLVVLEGLGTFEAYQASVRHISAHLPWHAGVWVVLLVIVTVLNATGIGGLLVMPVVVAHQVVAYQMAWGPEGSGLGPTA